VGEVNRFGPILPAKCYRRMAAKWVFISSRKAGIDRPNVSVKALSAAAPWFWAW
jgi:hypothetical protein